MNVFETEREKVGVKHAVEEMDARMARSVKRGGLTFEQSQKKYEQQMLRFRTCDLCGKACRTMDYMLDTHRNSHICLRAQAENKNEEYIIPSKRMVTCECGDIIMQQNLKRHRGGDKHKKNIKPRKTYDCVHCKITFGGKRPSKAYKQHCNGKKHKLAVAKVTTRVV